MRFLSSEAPLYVIVAIIALKRQHPVYSSVLTGDFPEAGPPQDILHTAVSVLGLADEAPWA